MLHIEQQLSQMMCEPSTLAPGTSRPPWHTSSDVPLLPRTSDGLLVLLDGRRVQVGEEDNDCHDVDELDLCVSSESSLRS